MTYWNFTLNNNCTQCTVFILNWSGWSFLHSPQITVLKLGINVIAVVAFGGVRTFLKLLFLLFYNNLGFFSYQNVFHNCTWLDTGRISGHTVWYLKSVVRSICLSLAVSDCFYEDIYIFALFFFFLFIELPFTSMWLLRGPSQELLSSWHILRRTNVHEILTR